MYPCLFNMYMNVVMKEKRGWGGWESEISGEGERVEITSPLVCRRVGLCGGSEKDLKMMVGRFVEV